MNKQDLLTLLEILQIHIVLKDIKIADEVGGKETLLKLENLKVNLEKEILEF